MKTLEPPARAASPMRPLRATRRISWVTLQLIWAYALAIAPWVGAPMIILGVLLSLPALRYAGLLILAGGCAYFVSALLAGHCGSSCSPASVLRSLRSSPPRRAIVIATLAGIQLVLIAALAFAAIGLLRLAL